jgi:hypothetical protein
MFQGISRLYDHLAKGVDHTSQTGEADIAALLAFCAPDSAHKAG